MILSSITAQKTRQGPKLHWQFHSGSLALGRVYCAFGGEAELSSLRNTLNLFLQKSGVNVHEITLQLVDDAGTTWTLRRRDNLFECAKDAGAFEPCPDPLSVLHLIWEKGSKLLLLDREDSFVKNFLLSAKNPLKAMDYRNFQKQQELAFFLEKELSSVETKLRRILQSNSVDLSAFCKEAGPLLRDLKQTHLLLQGLEPTMVDCPKDVKKQLSLLQAELGLLAQMEGLLILIQQEQSFGYSREKLERIEQELTKTSSQLLEKTLATKDLDELLRLYCERELLSTWLEKTRELFEEKLFPFRESSATHLNALENLLFDENSTLAQLDNFVQNEKDKILRKEKASFTELFGKKRPKEPNILAELNALNFRMSELRGRFVRQKKDFFNSMNELAFSLNDARSKLSGVDEQLSFFAKAHGLQIDFAKESFSDGFERLSKIYLKVQQLQEARACLLLHRGLHSKLYQLLKDWRELKGLRVTISNSYPDIVELARKLVQTRAHKDSEFQRLQELSMVAGGQNALPQFLDRRRRGSLGVWAQLLKKHGVEGVTYSEELAQTLLKYSEELLQIERLLAGLSLFDEEAFLTSTRAPLSTWTLRGLLPDEGGFKERLVERLKSLSSDSLHILFTEDPALLAQLKKISCAHLTRSVLGEPAPVFARSGARPTPTLGSKQLSTKDIPEKGTDKPHIDQLLKLLNEGQPGLS